MRDQQVLFGPVASDATAFRVIDRIATDPALLQRLRAGRARARENAWDAGAAPARVVIDIDATLITAHSEKEGAAGTFKRGFGFHPLLAYLDCSREALAGVLRPGNAGANTASDHVEIVDLALEQLPRAVVETAELVVRTDSAAATHEFTDELRAARVGFLMGYDLTAGVREAILGLPDAAWRPAIRQDGQTRDGAWVAELTDDLDLSAWPDGTRVIVRPRAPAARCTALVLRPRRLDPAPGARRRARRLRAQDAALSAAAYRRPPGLPRPPRNAAPATHLALGQRPGRRVRAPGRAATTRALNRADASDDDHAPGPVATLIAARRRLDKRRRSRGNASRSPPERNGPL